jgi:peptidoglycan hydrolase-like protein with peptidoglycan-binding domain
LGSLRSKLKLIGAGTSFILLLIVNTGGKSAVEDFYNNLTATSRIEQRITTEYGGENCFTTATLEVDRQKLLDATANDMNFEAPGLSDVARARAVCMTQLALEMSGHPVGPIDGIYGPSTRGSLERFAHDQRLPADITNHSLRFRLAAALHVGVQALGKT